MAMCLSTTVSLISIRIIVATLNPAMICNSWDSSVLLCPWIVKIMIILLWMGLRNLLHPVEPLLTHCLVIHSKYSLSTTARKCPFYGPALRGPQTGRLSFTIPLALI
uniref:Uncharacterized protein n=1 Tax=Cacopsylla melanoneura TaxID=428564 RepID=A0A8D8X9G6_9HEMI